MTARVVYESDGRKPGGRYKVQTWMERNRFWHTWSSHPTKRKALGQARSWTKIGYGNLVRVIEEDA